MRFRALIFLMLTVILAAGTAYVFRRSIDRRTQVLAVAPPAPKVAVLVAAMDLPAGRLITSGDLRWQSWPSAGLGSEYAREGQVNLQDYAGSVVGTHIAVGEPITAGMLIKPGERGFLAAVLHPGMRGESVNLSTTSDAGGLLLPGDHVDLIWSYQVKKDAAAGTTNDEMEYASETLLVDLRVVAINDDVDDLAKKAVIGKTVTLEVSPKQVETVEMAKQNGTLSLALRSVGDGEVADVQPGSFTLNSDVSSLFKLTVPKKVRSGGVSVTVVRGGDQGNANATTMNLPSGDSGAGASGFKMQVNFSGNVPGAADAASGSSK